MKTKVLISSLILLLACNGNKQGAVIGLRQNIHHDDFEYSVSDYTVKEFLTNGNDTIKARGVFYIVNFKVENRALRVGHKWDNSIAYIVDGEGYIFENNRNAQNFYEMISPFGLHENYNTMAGKTDSVILVFDLPQNISEPYLKVRGNILMGDIPDRARFRKMKIKLFK